MKLTKDNINLMHHDKMWFCEIYIGYGFKYKNGWAWSESAKQAVSLARNNLE